MPLTMELVSENSRSWFRWYTEYNIVRTSFEDLTNLKNKMLDPNVIHAIRVWMKSNDDYNKKKHDYHANKTSEGWEAWQHAEWLRTFNVNQVILLVEGRPGFSIGNYEEWLIQKKKKMPKELPDDVLSIIREYSKPVFKWYKEYNEAKFIFERQYMNKDLIKLKEKWDDPTVREQVKRCIDAYKKGDDAYKSGHHIDLYCKEHWWFSIHIKRLDALLYDQEYRMLSYAEWVFKDDIDDAWADSDISWDDEAGLALQEQWMMEEEEELF
jgi:hypothetical protein